MLNGLDERDFVEDIMLSAQNDGDAYRAKSPEAAISKAFAAFQERRREEEAETFEIFRRNMEQSLRVQWSRTWAKSE